MLARLMADPNAHSVENLERRHRLESESPKPVPPPPKSPSVDQSSSAALPPMPTGGVARSADELESDLQGRLNLGRNNSSDQQPEPKTLMSPMAFTQAPKQERKTPGANRVQNAYYCCFSDFALFVVVSPCRALTRLSLRW